MAGDCYRANGNFIITKMNDKSFKLCHGVAILATDGKPFGHCWVEKSNSLVMDFSNGKKIALSKKKYYELGGIPANGKKIHKYSVEETMINMLKHEHWGPWDYNPPR
jgi:hypothetical protein